MTARYIDAGVLREQGWVLGIDVSDHQHPDALDWAKLHASGVRYAWVKLTEGKDWTARHAKAHAEGANEAGMRVGGYHFARPDINPNDAKREALHFASEMYNVGETLVGGLPPVQDYERLHRNRKDREWADKFDRELKSVIGVQPWFYSYLSGYVYAKPAASPLWTAAYINTMAEANVTASACWQYSGSGRLHGSDVQLDLNIMRPEMWESICKG
jgi:lysozyme